MLPGTQRVNAAGHLEVGGCDAVALAHRFGTPLYLVDEAAFRDKCRAYLAAIRARYPRVEVAYAAKAFLCTGFCRIVAQEGLNLDVASGGELFTALQARFPPDRITLHGNNKSAEELRMALDAGVSRIVADNFHELDLLAGLTRESDTPVDLSLRVAPGIDPDTHRLIRTGQVDTKFGFDIASGAALLAAARVRKLPAVRLRGLHCHLGSNLKDAEAHCQAAAILVDLVAEIMRREGLEVEEVNLGGGLGIRYLEEERSPDLDGFAESVTAALKAALDRRDLRWPVLQLEPGRYLVGEAGTTLYTVGSLKEIPGLRTYVAVDGGLSDNPRPALYEARYEALLANRAQESRDFLVTIAGKHCETDILIRDILLPRPVPGDLVAVQCTGAYNHAMASNYNRFRRPAVVLVHEGQAELLVERERYEDLVRHDRIPAHLV